MRSHIGFGRERRKHQKHSYAQCGEDLIVRFIFNQIGISAPSYWDVGAYDPYRFSNTALLYENGCRGVNVEPNPALFDRFERYRKSDTNLNVGVSGTPGQGKYYLMDAPALNTFSYSSTQEYVREGHKVIGEVMLPMVTMLQISERYFRGMWPDFLSLDVEGMDMEILETLPYDCDQLHVICVETISYSKDGSGVKDTRTAALLGSRGYFQYADTYINTIFVKKASWYKRSGAK
jgi:FkbM family methyltransferase